jgi:serine/threonine protein kinase
MLEDGESIAIFSKKAKLHGDDSEDPKGLEDFKILKVIDKGSFGKVFLVKNKTNDKLYAMKRIRKDILIEKGQIQNTKNERDILLSLEHPFLLG